MAAARAPRESANPANRNGGAIDAFAATLALSGGFIESNSAGTGAGISLAGSSTATIDEMTFESNASDGPGGATVAAGIQNTNEAGVQNSIMTDTSFGTTDHANGSNFDEAGDVGEMHLRTWVNGELRQDASVADLIFDIPTLIETISEGITLLPGDVILTGTPVGCGIGFEPPVFLQSGDVVKVTIDPIGTIENRVE